MSQEIRMVKDDAKGVTRIFHYESGKKTHIGDITFDTNELTVCPDLECPQRVVPALGALLRKASNVLTSYTPPDKESPLFAILII